MSELMERIGDQPYLGRTYHVGAPGTGEYAGLECAEDAERKAAGLPGVDITWGVEPGEWHRAMLPQLRTELPAAYGWRMKLARWLAKDWFHQMRISVSNDIDRGQRMLREAEQMAYTDPLTGVANRRLFEHELGQQLARAGRNDELVALLYIDVDYFKEVNDTYGHDGGDVLLCQLAGLLKSITRKGDVVGRLGGDEFAVMLSGIRKPTDVTAVAQKILDGLHEWDVSASIGIAVGRDDDPATILARADEALYSVKEAGRDGYRVFPADGWEFVA